MMLLGKSAVVTGGAAGIGLAICECFAREGAKVVIADVDETRGRALEDRLRADRKDAWFVPFDAGNVSSINQMISEAIGLVGRLDILVNNAGVTRRIGILDINEQDWDWIQSVNTKGLFFCLQRVAAHMKEKGGGKIVNMASVAGKGVKGTSNACYAASKASAIAVARVAANELGRYNINVNSVCPGATRTELMDKIEAANPQIIADMIVQSARHRF
jgi:3-oxoacyl-[acyl-carrier protein] reductase